MIPHPDAFQPMPEMVSIPITFEGNSDKVLLPGKQVWIHIYVDVHVWEHAILYVGPG